MKTEITSTSAEEQQTRTFRQRLNILLLRVVQVEVPNKKPENFSLGELFGNLDAAGILILLFSLFTALVVSVLMGLLFTTNWGGLSLLVYLAAIPGVFAGFAICYSSFRIKRLLQM